MRRVSLLEVLLIACLVCIAMGSIIPDQSSANPEIIRAKEIILSNDDGDEFSIRCVENSRLEIEGPSGACFRIIAHPKLSGIHLEAPDRTTGFAVTSMDWLATLSLGDKNAGLGTVELMASDNHSGQVTVHSIDNEVVDELGR